jgi:hypothetical protein
MGRHTWERHHIRLTIRIIQTGPTRFEIPLSSPSGALIPIDGSLEDAQRMGDAVSGCPPRCTCPAWFECEVPREKANTSYIEDTSLPQVSWRVS